MLRPNQSRDGSGSRDGGGVVCIGVEISGGSMC